MTINQRTKLNLIHVAVTLVVLFLAVEISTGSFATRINNISENLDRALSAVMAEKSTNYTELPNNSTYISNITFNPKGMAGLYNFTNAYMDAVLNKDIYPTGFLDVDTNGNLHLGDYQEEWKGLLKTYGGLLAMIIILAILIVFLPLCGLCFCCCRCCGKCGARSRASDKKHDLCTKIILSTLLIGLGTLLLFGVVCAFVTNQQMEEGVDSLSDNLRDSVKDVNMYLESTKQQLNTLLGQNYKEFEDVLISTINDSTDVVYDELANYSKATTMTELFNMVNNLSKVGDNLRTLRYSTNSLRVYASQLNDAIRKIKKDLLALLQSDECRQISKCAEINGNISNLQTNIHFNSLPDISAQIATLDKLIEDTDLETAVSSGNAKLAAVRDEIGNIVNDTLVKAKEKISEAGKAISQGNRNITDVVDDLKKQIDDNTTPALNSVESYINDYAKYRYYVAIGLSSILLLVALCLALGLICGICGKRPDGYGDDCCNKGAGSSFLICGVMVMFLGGLIIAVVVLFSFLVGIVTQRLACDPLRDPTNSQVFALIDNVNFSQYYINVKISEVINDCHHDKSIYEVFRLNDHFKLDEVKDYINQFDINKTLADLDISNVYIPTELLNTEEKQLIEDFANSDFANLKFDEFEELLQRNFTSADLTVVSRDLEEIIDQLRRLPSLPSTQKLIDDMQVSKLNLDMYQERIVEPMIKNATEVQALAREVEEGLKMGKGSFKEAIDQMLVEIKDTETLLSDQNGIKSKLEDIARDFTNGIVTQIQGYLDRVFSKTSNDVGRCGPLSAVMNSTLTATCDRIVLPWNGYWFGLFWSLLLFIPTIIISVKLGTLYQKHSPYSADSMEAEYLYDAYLDRDNIPLNSRGGKSKKKNNKQKRDDRPLPSGAGDMVSREYAVASNHQDTRYADMAPKQWEDFPAGGPPQYQRAPTEYERPPPYYYPGAGETTQ